MGIQVFKLVPTQGEDIAKPLKCIIKILNGVAAGFVSHPSAVDDIIHHDRFELLAQFGHLWQGRRHGRVCPGGWWFEGLLIELWKNLVQGPKKEFKLAKQQGGLIGAMGQQLPDAALLEHRRVIISGAGIEVVGLVNNENAVVVRPILKKPPQVGAGIKDIVVIANNHIDFGSHI